MTEAQLELAILEYLNSQNWFAFKVKDKVLHARRRFEVNGVSDIIALRNGETLYIEVKTTSGKQSDYQVAFQSKVEEKGGTYCLVKDLEGAVEINEKYGLDEVIYMEKYEELTKA